MKRILFLLALSTLTLSSGQTMHSSTNPPVTREAYFGGGCFWCLEAMFEKVRGVVDVTNGYAGGQTPDPTYQEVCSDRTGHAEVVRITYDPRKITYGQLLDLFWQSHDPTTVDRQGADVGSQYRSIILTTTDEEQRLAEAAIRTVNASGRFPRPVVTEVKPLDRFYPAEDYHQDYFQKHPDVPYCVFVIQPKLEKFEHASGAKNLIQK